MKTNNLSIFYVEDEPELRELICGFLKMEGFQCTVAENGLDAKKIASQKRFDVIIVDFTLPTIRGEDFLFWCRESSIHTPIIFFTGSLELTDRQKLALEDCCCSLLIKPASFDTISEFINKALNRKHEFDCTGIITPPSDTYHFTGQHLWPSKSL